jgi:putative ABC transport system ATP-binding protein
MSAAEENVEVPLRLVKADPVAREERVAVLLELVGLGQRGRHRPHELSGASSSAWRSRGRSPTRPDLLLADELTGQLDSATGRSIMSLRAVVRSGVG